MSVATHSGTATIYVALLEEGGGVWRPVEAVSVGGGVYRLPPNPDPETETWEFEDAEVMTDTVNLSEGPTLVATHEVASPSRVSPDYSRVAARR